MIKHWINKSNNKNCILFFNGWGMDEKAISHLDCTGFDVCMFYDYSALEVDATDLGFYDSLIVVAWSLGVWVANQALKDSKLKIKHAIAINGTELPISNEYGIPPEVFKGTLKFWNEENREKFNQRVFGGRLKLEQAADKLPHRNCENQKQELAFLLDEIEDISETNIKWNTVLIGTLDLIFSEKNQSNYWNLKSKTIEKALPHYPFAEFASWQQIIDL